MSEIKSEYHFDKDTGEFTRHDTQECDQILKDNAEELASGDNDRRGAHARKFASVPLVVLKDWEIRFGLKWELIGIDPHMTGLFMTLIKDPDHLKFRTSEANLGNGNQFNR